MAFTLEQLREIRMELEKSLPFFPKTCCPHASCAVRQKTDMLIIPGYFFSEDGWRHTHVWNYDIKDDIYVDLTADQFDSSLPPVYIIPRNSAEAKRYLPVIDLPE